MVGLFCCDCFRAGPLPKPVWKFFLIKGYLWDWFVCAVFLIVNYVVPLHIIEPVERFRPDNDPSLMYPLENAHIDPWVMYFLTFSVPVVFFTALQWRFRSWVDWHNGLLSVAEGFTIACTFQRWLNLTGRYRPNWNITQGTTGSVTSYPNAPSSYLLMSATVISMYLLGKFQVFSRPAAGQFGFAAMCLLPLGLGLYLSATRLNSYYADFSDFNAGCFIGIASGIFGYYLNFECLFNVASAEPRKRTPRAHQAMHIGGRESPDDPPAVCPTNTNEASSSHDDKHKRTLPDLEGYPSSSSVQIVETGR